MVINNVLIVDPIAGERVGTIEVESDRIVSVKHSSRNDYDLVVFPGFFDPHTHGSVGIDTMELDRTRLREWESFLYTQGVTSFLPTTVSASSEALQSAGEFIEDYMRENAFTAVRGIHYEGPYISKRRKGAQNPDYIRCASPDEIDSLPLSICRIITLAPEEEGFEQVADLMVQKGIVVSAGHTDATYDLMKKAFEKGCRRMTHFPNGMRGFHHRELGCLGAGLALSFSLELISDGVHSVSEFVKFLYSVKGAEKVILVTDSMSAAGLEDGKYLLGGLGVLVTDGKATLEDGTLAGSTLLFSEGVRKFRSYTGCSLTELSRMSSFNAVDEIGIPDRGRIVEGYKADLVIMSKELEVLKTILSGQVVYDAA